MSSLVEGAVNSLQDEGFQPRNVLRDENGVIGQKVAYEGDEFIVVAKEYSYEGLASFMHRLVEKAESGGADLIFFSAGDKRYTVFDGQYYKKHADVSWGPSKKDQTKWLELSRHHGVDLDEFLEGGEPNTLAGDNATLGKFA